MTLISGQIPEQGFEKVRDRIAVILAAELTNQANLYYDPYLNPAGDGVYTERFVTIQESECENGPVVNVQMERGDFRWKTIKDAEGSYRYFIEVTTKARSASGDRGDSKAKIRLQKMMGKIRAILSNPKYVRLGFDDQPRFIERVTIESLIFFKPEEHSADNGVQGFVVLVVQLNENTNLDTFDVIQGFDTVVNLSDTDKGYIFSGTTFPYPPVSGSNVKINDTDFAFVEEGETLEIQVVDEDSLPVGQKVAEGVWQVPNSAGGAATVENSDDSFHQEVAAGDTLVLEDYTINAYIGGSLFSTQDVPAMADITINFN